MNIDLISILLGLGAGVLLVLGFNTITGTNTKKQAQKCFKHKLSDAISQKVGSKPKAFMRAFTNE